MNYIRPSQELLTTSLPFTSSSCRRKSQSLYTRRKSLSVKLLISSCFVLFACMANNTVLGVSLFSSTTGQVAQQQQQQQANSNLSSSFKKSNISCSPQQFQCHDGKKCIPETWKCDGDNDCSDASDELTCDSKTCSPTEFRCNNGKCISDSWKCDNEDDCGDRSDELGCAIKSCDPESEFKCYSGGRCIPISWKCDGQNDCPDGEDEPVECEDRPCNHENEFSCNNGKCIAKKFVCDQEDDCDDGSDEQHCPPVTCKPEQFTCAATGKCIPRSWICDGAPDCRDGSDEHNCTSTIVHSHGSIIVNHTTCGAREFQCLSGECIHIGWKCDGSPDCLDHSDETNCPACEKEEFQCRHSRQCFSMDKKCDGKVDCSDKTDEEDCPRPAKKESKCKPDEFTCASSTPEALKCIKKTAVCDKSNDCDDWSDEPSTCNLNECEDPSLNHCSQECFDDGIGYHCGCRKGFKLGTDNRTCEDIDECTDIPGTCSGHPCTNTKGHFKCHCKEGYEVKEHKYCKLKTALEAYLLATTRRDIRTVSLTPAFPYFSHRKSHYDDYYDNLRSAVAIDYSLTGNYLIWSDVVEEKMYIGLLNKSRPCKFVSGKEKQVLIGDNLGVVDGLTIDYVHDLVYWTDTKTDRIEVAFLQEPSLDNPNVVGRRMTIIDSELDEPRAIAVNVRDGYLFWSDWGDHAKIERSSQDGSDRRIIVEDNLIWPNGLAIDYITNSIYWTDVKLNNIESADFYGANRRIILHSETFVSHPFGIAVFEDHIYWSDWATLTVTKTNKFISNGSVEHVLGPLYSINDIAVVHSKSQPKEARNRCSNEGCSHFCLPSGGLFGFKCLCPSDKNGIKYNLSNDGRSCLREDNSFWMHSGSRSVVPAEHSPSSIDHVSIDEIPLQTVVVLEDNPRPLLIPAIFGLFVIVASGFLLVSLICYRHYRRRNVRSMNFDNPVYRKTTEEQFVLEKSDNELDSRLSPFLSSMEPLTSPGTNEFV